MLAPRPALQPAATDVCLVLEGTYPYVAGGVSSWVHDLVRCMPELGFALLHISPLPGAYGPPRYVVPANVTCLLEQYCHVGSPPLDSALREHLRNQLSSRIRVTRRSHPVRSRTLEALRRLHLEDTMDDQLIEDLAAGDLDVDQLLHGDDAFEVLTEVYRARAPSAPFLDFFWHFRSMHVPLVRLLAAELPRAQIYHSVSTGYAGALAAVASRRSGRPMLLTEHGIYARERDMELSRASWIDEPQEDLRLPAQATSPLRRFWSRFFMRLSHIAYWQSKLIVTLSRGNRAKQLSDGAAADRTTIVANGVDVDQLTSLYGEHVARKPTTPLRVGFVGRVVPIKDVITFIKACDLALREASLSIEIIGPTEEDPAYAQRCRELVHTLGRDDAIRFVGPRPLAEIYNHLDVVVLTSFSEGQPLVILEAHAAGVPVIATDVGACREMLEGHGVDRDVGPSGIITRVASPEATAKAMVKLARDTEVRERMGAAGRARVQASYTKTRMIGAYRSMYGELAS